MHPSKGHLLCSPPPPLVWGASALLASPKGSHHQARATWGQPPIWGRRGRRPPSVPFISNHVCMYKPAQAQEIRAIPHAQSTHTHRWTSWRWNEPPMPPSHPALIRLVALGKGGEPPKAHVWWSTAHRLASCRFSACSWAVSKHPGTAYMPARLKIGKSWLSVHIHGTAPSQHGASRLPHPVRPCTCVLFHGPSPAACSTVLLHVSHVPKCSCTHIAMSLGRLPLCLPLPPPLLSLTTTW